MVEAMALVPDVVWSITGAATELLDMGATRVVIPGNFLAGVRAELHGRRGRGGPGRLRPQQLPRGAEPVRPDAQRAAAAGPYGAEADGKRQHSEHESEEEEERGQNG